MLHVFVDTTLTYSDPFFKSVSNKFLLKLLEELGGTLYVSTVVFEETKHHLRSNLTDRIRNLKSSIGNFNKTVSLDLEIKIDENINKHITDLENFYNELAHDGLLEFIDYSNDILPTIVSRAIDRKKPFSENKDEFRDSIIWLSYANYVNEQSLNNCYFITANISDFYSEDKQGLHEDLKQDCENMKLVKSSKEILHSQDEIIRSGIEKIEVIQRLKQWIINNPINTENLLTLFENDFCHNKIDYYLTTFLEEGNIPTNLSVFADHLEMDMFEITNIKEIHYEIIEDEIYISGSLELEVYVDIMIYNSFRDPGEDRFFKEDSTKLDMELVFSLIHKGEEGLEDFEIDQLWRFREAESEDFA